MSQYWALVLLFLGHWEKFSVTVNVDLVKTMLYTHCMICHLSLWFLLDLLPIYNLLFPCFHDVIFLSHYILFFIGK